MGQILALLFDVQKLPGFRFGTLPPDRLTGVPLCPAGALPQSPEMESRCTHCVMYPFQKSWLCISSMSHYRSKPRGHALGKSAHSGLPLTWKWPADPTYHAFEVLYCARYHGRAVSSVSDDGAEHAALCCGPLRWLSYCCRRTMHGLSQVRPYSTTLHTLELSRLEKNICSRPAVPTGHHPACVIPTINTLGTMAWYLWS